MTAIVPPHPAVGLGRGRAISASPLPALAVCPPLRSPVLLLLGRPRRPPLGTAAGAVPLAVSQCRPAAMTATSTSWSWSWRIRARCVRRPCRASPRPRVGWVDVLFFRLRVAAAGVAWECG